MLRKIYLPFLVTLSFIIPAQADEEPSYSSLSDISSATVPISFSGGRVVVYPIDGPSNPYEAYYTDERVYDGTRTDMAYVSSQRPVSAGRQIEYVSKGENTADKGLWGAEWSGNINFGADLKTGNSETNGINLDGMIKAAWEKHTLEAKVDYNREEEDGDLSVDNRALAFIHDYLFSKRWFIENTAKFEQDDIDLLDARYTLSSGLGYKVFDRDDLALKFVLGPGYLHEEFKNGMDDSSMTARWAADYMQKFSDDLFRVFHEHELLTPVDDADAFLFQSESGIRVPIRRGIVASGQIDFDWDNDPAAGTVEDDTTYALKLGYEW